MKDWFHDISELTVIELFLIAVVLFLILRIVQKGLSIYMRKKNTNPVISRFFPLVEFAIWVIFLTWGAKQIFQTGIAGSILLIILMVGILTWAGSFVVRDWIAGVVFKAEDRYRMGDIISFQDTRGRLTHLGYRSLTIEVPDGGIVEIPYSALVRENTIEKTPRETACSMFNLAVPSKIPLTEVQQKIQTIALCTPWSSIIKKPNIRIIERNEKDYTIEVTAFMIDQIYAPEVEAYVKQHLEF